MGPEGGKHWIFLAWLSVKVTHWGPGGDASKHLPSESSCQGSHCGRTRLGSRGCTYISVPSNNQCEREDDMPRSWFHFALFLAGKCSSCSPGSHLVVVSDIHFNDMKAESLTWSFSYCLWMIWMTDEEKKKKRKTRSSEEKFTAISINHYLAFIDIFQNVIQFVFKITNISI